MGQLSSSSAIAPNCFRIPPSSSFHYCLTVAGFQIPPDCISDLDFARTLTLATTLQPDIRHVFCIGGAATGDTFYLNLARSRLRGRDASVTFTYLSGLTR